MAEQRKRDNQSGDLIGTLVHAEIDGDRLDESSIIYESLLILIGGDETTRHVISGGMYELLRHPDQLRKLAADRSLMQSAVEEMLRWVTPIKNMARRMTRDVEFGGETLREGQKLLLLYPSANRDERVFDRPDEFDITRSPNDHMAFGFGSHFCLGNRLARMELSVMFDRLLDRLPDSPWWRTASHRNGPPISCPAMSRCPWSSLHRLRWEHRPRTAALDSGVGRRRRTTTEGGGTRR